MGRTVSLFFAANLLAGVFNYLFQAIAGTRLDAASFAQLNSWLAHVSIFFFLGGIFQYLALFGSLTQLALRRLLVVALIGLSLLTALWVNNPDALDLPKALILLSGSVLYGWVIGCAQKRMLFGAMAAATMVVGLAKVGILIVPIFGQSLANYAFALFAGFIPAFLIMAISLWNKEGDKKSSFTFESWNQTLILSLATAAFPQIDLILFHHTQTPELYSEFVRASLYFKAIYFLVFIFAQWLLPHQIQRPTQTFFSHSGWLIFAVGLIGSLALASTSPFTSKVLFGWEQAPEWTMVFLSSLNAVLLAWIFILLQGACARYQMTRAWSALFCLALGAVAQFFFAPVGYLYFVIALGAAFVALALLQRTK